MKKTYYNKLVRDKIQSIIEGKGSACEIITIADPAEYEQELMKKVAEEARALSLVRTRDTFLHEYADLMVALDALTRHLEFSEADIQAAIMDNVDKKGLYNEKQFLRWSSAEDGYVSNESPQGVS